MPASPSPALSFEVRRVAWCCVGAWACCFCVVVVFCLFVVILVACCFCCRLVVLPGAWLGRVRDVLCKSSPSIAHRDCELPTIALQLTRSGGGCWALYYTTREAGGGGLVACSASTMSKVDLQYTRGITTMEASQPITTPNTVAHKDLLQVVWYGSAPPHTRGHNMVPCGEGPRKREGELVILRLRG